MPRPDDTSKAPNAAPPTGQYTGSGISRRKVLGGLVLGSAAISVPSIAAAQTGGGRRRDDGGRNDRNGRNDDDGGPGPNVDINDVPDLDRFSRMFGQTDAFDGVNDEMREQFQALGAPGGPLDAGDPLEAGPELLINQPGLSPNNPDNTASTAGATFVGQFLDHDITLDAESRLGRRTPVRRSVNLRSARLDLDSVYGGGPLDSPALYEDDDPFRFRVESGGQFEDLPRRADGSAIIGDDRNDENMIIGGLHAAFLLFHNQVMDRVVATGLDDEAAFVEARRQVRWHWQWMVLNEFLPLYVGQSMVDDIVANGRRFYTPNTPRIPVEFQTSAYRFGHSMVRPSYQANVAGDDGNAFFGMTFDPSQMGVDDPADMAGGHRAPRRFIGWQSFFDFGVGPITPSKQINTRISTPLFQLPMGVISSERGEPIGPTSLATRNLLRHITWEIPSGQEIAAEMGESPLSAADLSDITDVAPILAGRTPLWLWVLREAELIADGAHLGPVGGRIVAEVLIGLIELDPASMMSDPGWRPTLPSRLGTGEFDMVDMLTIAGVDPDSRGQ